MLDFRRESPVYDLGLTFKRNISWRYRHRASIFADFFDSEGEESAFSGKGFPQSEFNPYD